MAKTPTKSREGDYQKVLEKIEAMLRDIAYGSLTLKIRDNRVYQIHREETELID